MCGKLYIKVADLLKSATIYLSVLVSILILTKGLMRKHLKVISQSNENYI
jgi:hypothetical protein